MKATLSFDLEDIDDRLAHNRCVKSLDMALAFWDIGNILADMWHTEDGSEVEMFRKRIQEVIDNYNIVSSELTR